MDAQTPQGPKSLKFTANDCQVQISMDWYQQQIKVRLKCLKNLNIYESTFDESTLPQELKTFLSNIKTVYEYIEVNRSDPQKIIIEETGLIRLVFVLSFGPNSQIKKQIALQIELKQVGSAQGSNFKQHFDKIREEIVEMSKKHEEDRMKLKAIILTVEKSNQRLVCESEALKLQNVQFRNKFDITEQKLDALQILLKDLYTQFQNLREEKQQTETEIQSQKPVLIIPPNIEDSCFKRQVHNILRTSQKDNDCSMIKKLKSLQQERDSQRKNFQQKLAQKQLRLSQKISNIKQNASQSSEQFIPEAQMLGNFIKDSDFQQLKNTVSPFSSKKQINKTKTKNNVNIVDTSLTRGSSVMNGLTTKVGLTGKYYCGGKLCKGNCTICKGPCGPYSGQNCSACMKLDLQRRRLKKGFLVNANGQVSWLQNAHFCCGIGCENGAYNCGLGQKYCQWCKILTQNYSHRYKQLL